MLLDRIDNILLHECKLDCRSPLLVGVSGGPDSLCLLHLLCQIGYPIIAMHVDHKLRPEAGDEVQVVKQFASNLGVDLINCQVDVLAYAHKNACSIEEAARTLRYLSLFEQAKSCDVKAVVVGHNADDQVETILMHLLRGSAMPGLRGMEYCSVPNPWSHHIPLVRPLLSTWRAEIQEYIDAQAFKPVTDSSNLDIAYLRNRIRHELIPILESYNPSIREVLFRMGQIMKDDYSVLDRLTGNAWESTFIRQGNGYLAFRTSVFLELPLSIQRYLLRRAISYHLPGLRDVGFDCIERGISILAGDKPKTQIDLIAGLRLVKEGEQFWLATWQADLPGVDFPALKPGGKLVLIVPSTHILDNGWKLEVEEICKPDLVNLRSNATADPYQAWMDASVLDLPLIARVRMPGDHIKPLGMDGHTMKITDLMINFKMPSRARARWPLILWREEIVWVPGYRQSHLARIKPKTSSAIHLTLRRI